MLAGSGNEATKLYIMYVCFSLVFTWRAAEVNCNQPRAARKVPASWVWGKKELISRSCRHWFRKIRSRVEETWVWKKGSVVLSVIVVCTMQLTPLVHCPVSLWEVQFIEWVSENAWRAVGHKETRADSLARKVTAYYYSPCCVCIAGYMHYT